MSNLVISQAAIVIVTGVFGLLIGSFLNVIVYRVPAGLSLIPSSRCPKCDAPVRPWQNVPVLSWLALRGKCAACTETISVRYPLVELGTGLAFAAVAWWWSGAVNTPVTPAAVLQLSAYVFLVAVSIALALIDIDTFRLPDAIVLPSIALLAALFTIAGALSGDWGAVLRAGAGGASLTVFYGLLWFFWPGGMGFGDVKLAAVLGMALGWIGWGALLVGAFAAFVAGGIFGVALIALKKAGRKSRVPFGPWMLVGAWAGIFWGESTAAWYLDAFIA